MLFRSEDTSLMDCDSPGASPKTSSWAGSATMRETLEKLRNSNQDYETGSSSSSPVKESCSMNPVTVAVKKSRRRFHFIVGKKAPVISIRLKVRKTCYIFII